ncbi:MAG TPA: aspartate carbamoyltransferase catalytic subunit, partial [Chloroflexota bacterium]|nr:aspartate carbamoyltransferase catalytic subunit [Chloroflexota bacterium]
MVETTVDVLEKPGTDGVVPLDQVAREPFRRRHVLDLDDFSAGEILKVLDTADIMKDILRRPIKKVPTLRGKTVVTLFYEASTRTRVSFETAAKNLGADTVSVAATTSSVSKGESLVDTLCTLQALGADAVVMRHSYSGAPYLASRILKGSVINGGDGWHAHPTQGLLDVYTVREKLGRVSGLKVVILGDVLHSRVARSAIWSMTKLGAEVTVCGPATLLPSWWVQTAAQNDGQVMPGLRLSCDLDRTVEGADVVMALRLQLERMQAGLLPSKREYIRMFQLNSERVSRAKPGALVMHPGPMNEGIEIAPDVAHGDQSVVEAQVSNGVAIRMALLYLLIGPNATVP